MDLDIKIFRMHGLGIPQDRIAKRLGLARTSFQYHLPKMAALPNSAKADLSLEFTVAQLAEKNGMVSYPRHPGAHSPLRFSSVVVAAMLKKRHTGCEQQICDCPGPKQLTCRHFIDKAFMITKRWLRFKGVKTCSNYGKIWKSPSMRIGSYINILITKADIFGPIRSLFFSKWQPYTKFRLLICRQEGFSDNQIG
ncbi:MAG: hypothetical protein K9K63_06980 [Desulfotignum sp.]|nr:hypothetical protein [Desulfotignum sp.]MCF8137037.1 hypothetical protein [Desulfotignum sp.]